jgi:hypothetical protein
MTQQPKDLEALLISKAMADEAFKSELISNPKAVIAREIGQELPEGVEIEVLESTPKKLYLVLPLKVESEEIPTEELSDKELEAVAGGLDIGAVKPSAGGLKVFDLLTANFDLAVSQGKHIFFSKTHNPKKCK